MAAKKSDAKPRKKPRIPLSRRRLRSAIAQGRQVLEPVDRRTMRRLGHILDNHLSDLGGDVTHAERTLADRAAMLTLLAEMQENAFLKNGTPAVELDKYLHVNTALTRILLALGLRRRAKPIPTLQDYLAHRERETVEDEDDSKTEESDE